MDLLLGPEITAHATAPGFVMCSVGVNSGVRADAVSTLPNEPSP